MKLIITNIENAEIEPLQKAIERATNYSQGNHERIEIYCKVRVPDDAPDYKHPGWLEYFITFYKKDEHQEPSFFICMVQRNKNAEFEFHS